MRQRTNGFLFLALKLPLIIMSEGVEMGLGHDKPQQRTEKDPKSKGPQTPAQTTQQEALKGGDF